MKSYLTLTFLFISFSLIAQDAWFKHLNGFSAYKSFIQNDTIYTFGNKISYFRTYERYNATFDKTRIDGSQIHSDTISLDYLESDSLRSTLLRYPNSTVFHENDFSLGLSLSGNNKIDQVYITNFSKNMELLDTIKCTKDTFKTAIENIKFVNNHLIVAGFYSQSPTLLTSNLTTFIQYHDGKRVQWIKTYPQEPNNTRWRFINMISEKGKPFFFFDLQKQWDFRGSPEQWEDYIIKIDTLGNELWRCQPNNRYDINPTGMQMVQKPNGNLLVSWCDEYYRPYMDPNGPSQLSQLNRNCTLWFAEIDSSGKILWRKNIKSFLKYKLNRDSTHVVTHVKALPVKDGVLWVGNYALYYFHNYVLKTDFDGNPIWFREYELYPTNKSKSQFFPYDITSVNDGSFVITGEYQSAMGNIFPEGCQKATIIKVDSFGCLEPDCHLGDSIPREDSTSTKVQNVSKPMCKIFPNPATTELNIDFENPGKFNIKIYNQSGGLVIDLNESKSLSLETQNFPSGLYLIYIQAGNGEILTKKILIKH